MAWTMSSRRMDLLCTIRGLSFGSCSIIIILSDLYNHLSFPFAQPQMAKTRICFVSAYPSDVVPAQTTATRRTRAPADDMQT